MSLTDLVKVTLYHLQDFNVPNLLLMGTKIMGNKYWL